MSNHGGRRPGAGRKSNAEIKTMRALIDKSVTEKQWQELIRGLWRLAREGNLRAAQLLISYRFGEPDAAPDPDELKPISIIEVRLPADKPPAPPCAN